MTRHSTKQIYHDLVVFVWLVSVITFALADCPVDDGICPAIYHPVICKKANLSCTYSNACLAYGAGFASTDCSYTENDTSDHQPINSTTDIDEQPNLTCPSDEFTKCSRIYQPVVCQRGTVSCIYSNWCLANAAGYNSNECVLRHEEAKKRVLSFNKCLALLKTTCPCAQRKGLCRKKAMVVETCGLVGETANKVRRDYVKFCRRKKL